MSNYLSILNEILQWAAIGFAWWGVRRLAQAVVNILVLIELKTNDYKTAMENLDKSPMLRQVFNDLLKKSGSNK